MHRFTAIPALRGEVGGVKQEVIDVSVFNSDYPDMDEWTLGQAYAARGRGPGPRSIHQYQGNNMFIIPL